MKSLVQTSPKVTEQSFSSKALLIIIDMGSFHQLTLFSSLDWLVRSTIIFNIKKFKEGVWKDEEVTAFNFLNFPAAVAR